MGSGIGSHDRDAAPARPARQRLCPLVLGLLGALLASPTPALVIGIPNSGVSFSEREAFTDTIRSMGHTILELQSNDDYDRVDVLFTYPASDPGHVTRERIEGGLRFIQIGDSGGGWTPAAAERHPQGTRITLSLDAAHPITASLPASWDSFGLLHHETTSRSAVLWSTDSALASLVSETAVSNQARVLVADQIGLGRVVSIGWNVYGPDASAADLQLLRNAIQWAVAPEPSTAVLTLAGLAVLARRRLPARQLRARLARDRRLAPVREAPR